MSTKKPVSLGKKILYIIVTLAILFLGLEVVLSVFYYHKKSSNKLASIEFAYAVKRMLKPPPTPYNPANQKLVRPDSSQQFNEAVARETVASNGFAYQSWIDFKNINYAGQYVNVQDNIRKTIPDSYYSSASTDTLTIYFFGGSTMFGFNVADFETIPSYFVDLYKQKYPQAKSIKVVNYGCLNYFSKQELMLFSELLFNGNKPSIAVFFDGLNDFWFSKMLYKNQSFYNFYLEKAFFSGQPVSTTDKWFTDSVQQMFRSYPGIDETAYNQSLIDKYFRNIENIRKVAAIAGTKTYFFCQPVPFYNYPHQAEDPVTFKEKNTRFDYIYPIIEKRADSANNYFFLGNLLQTEKGNSFVDGFHYSPAIHRKIASAILNHMEKDLR